MSSKTFPTLYQVSSKGKTKVWEISALNNEYIVVHGYQDGKMQEDRTTVTPKNIGKANETSAFEQACSEAESKWNKKIDKGYTQDGKKPDNNIIYPMLAQSFAKSKHRIVYPCYTQPKMNGARCVHDDRYQSRSAKYWNTLSHLDTDVQMIQDLVGYPLDGEIYIHGLDLQDISALIKKERIDDEIEGYKTEDLEYWIYDCVATNLSFESRLSLIQSAFTTVDARLFEINGIVFARYNKIVLVHTEIARSEEDLQKAKKNFIAAGFEGGMARNNVGYVLCPGNHHSAELQKLKDWEEKEYKIIGGYSGVGRDKDCCTFTLETDGGKKFDCKPVGTVKQRKKYLKEIKSCINKLATVRYQELTKDSIPFHGRVLCIRDYE